MPTETDRAALDAIDARIAALRAARAPVRSVAVEKVSAASLGWRMVTELVVGVLMGAGIGWGLDSLTGTKPLFILIFGLLGFAAGVRVVLRTAEEARRREAGETTAGPRAAEKRPGPPPG